MNYTIEKGNGEVKINFALSAKEWDDCIEKAYLKNKSKYSVPGFRKGHVSRKMIEKMYGEGVFFDDAFNGTPFTTLTPRLLTRTRRFSPWTSPKSISTE